MFEYFWAIDFAPLLSALLASVSCSIVGCLLLARNQSMTVDAISHMVLPGMVVAFLLIGGVEFIVIFWGAVVAAALGIWLVDFLSHRHGHNRSAVLGMVFSFWFALGVFLLEVFVDTRAHFDVSHVLFGSLESSYWLDLSYLAEVGIISVLSYMPSNIAVLLLMLLSLIICIILFYKEIVMVSFDYNYAALIGFRAKVIYYAIPIVTSMIIVASFRMVGLIMILGMFVIPPLFASFLSARLVNRMLISSGLSVLLCLIGYAIAVYLPIFYRGDDSFSLNLGGTIVSSGLFLLLFLLLLKQFVGTKKQERATA